MEFGDKLIEQRRSRGLSQEQLADKLGVSRQAISRWEAGNAWPDVNNLKKISEIFAVSADYLLNDDCEQENEIRNPKTMLADKKRKLYKLSLFLVLFGMIGICVLVILSSQIPAIEMKPYVVSDVTQITTNQVEETDVTLYVQKEVHSFLPFLQYYHLTFVATGLLVMLAGGIALLIYVRKMERRKK